VRLENLIGIPKPPPFVKGVMNLKGDIIPVVDLRARLGIPGAAGPVEADPRRRRVVITRVGGRSYGLDVDEVREIAEIEDAGVTADTVTMAGVRADFLLGLARRGEELYMVLDLARLFAAGRDVPGIPAGQG
jgi:purine-binding chemotaxis protein CheW